MKVQLLAPHPDYSLTISIATSGKMEWQISKGDGLVVFQTPSSMQEEDIKRALSYLENHFSAGGTNGVFHSVDKALSICILPLDITRQSLQVQQGWVYTAYPYVIVGEEIHLYTPRELRPDWVNTACRNFRLAFSCTISKRGGEEKKEGWFKKPQIMPIYYQVDVSGNSAVERLANQIYYEIAGARIPLTLEALKAKVFYIYQQKPEFKSLTDSITISVQEK